MPLIIGSAFLACRVHTFEFKLCQVLFCPTACGHFSR